MNIIVSIKVRNSEFYEAFEEMKKSEGEISFEDWEEYNDNKIQKHSSFVTFNYSFVVNSYEVKKESEFDLEIIDYNNKDQSVPTKNTFHLDNVWIIEFLGDNNRSFVVISKELLYQKMNIQKGIEGVEYIYFYLKENSDNNRLANNIWLSDDKIEYLEKQFEDFTIEKDTNLIIRSEGGYLCVFDFYFQDKPLH